MKYTAILVLVLLLSACKAKEPEPQYETRYWYGIVLDKSMHESWTGDDFYVRARDVEDSVIRFRKIDKETYYCCKPGDKLAFDYLVQIR